MKILVLNSGSSSVKYQMWNTEGKGVLAKGKVSRIGIENPCLSHQPIEGAEVTVTPDGIIDHNEAIQLSLKALTNEDYGVITKVSEIEAVGHRVVHGGEKFSESTLIDEEAKEAIEDCIPLAPLHNPPNLKGIEACSSELPNVPQVAVFDTAFHQTMPEHAYLYALPLEIYEEHRIRRYGFHGTSHYFVASQAASMLEKPIEDLKIITAHLGNGASMAAVKNGDSVDTSMGFTPLEGLIMGTRSGDMDPYIPIFLQQREDLSPSEANELLNKESGLKGVSGISNDMRDVKSAAREGDDRAELAMDMYAYRIKKYVGAYAAAMGGLDALVFTAGVGENEYLTRRKAVSDLEFLGIEIDDCKNQNAVGDKTDISAADASVRTLVVPTDEEYVIANETERIVKS